MKNIFGKDLNELLYNKMICEAFLLNKTELYRQSLQKFQLVIEEYQKHYDTIPVEPLLYKISTYLKLALPLFFTNSEPNQEAYEHL